MGLGADVAAGEEIGWHGYMLTRLVDAGVAKPILTSGLIWGLWHVPLILGEVYPSRSTAARGSFALDGNSHGI